MLLCPPYLVSSPSFGLLEDIGEMVVFVCRLLFRHPKRLYDGRWSGCREPLHIGLRTKDVEMNSGTPHANAVHPERALECAFLGVAESGEDERVLDSWATLHEDLAWIAPYDLLGEKRDGLADELCFLHLA